MQRKSLTIFLYLALTLSVFVLLLLYGLIGPFIALQAKEMYSECASLFLPFLLYAEITALPTFFTVLEGYGMTHRFSQNRSFCKANVQALKRIGFYGLFAFVWYLLGIGGLFVAKLPVPILILALFVLSVMAVCVSCAAAVASHLFDKAQGMQEENDLTI